MSKKTDIHLLHEMITIPSPSGFEDQIADYIKEYVINLNIPNSKVHIDKQKNTIVEVKGKDSSKTVLVDAHSDTIGFIVSNVGRYGNVSINYIGGGCSTILSARTLRILSQKGPVNAIVDRKHSHLIADEDEENIYVPCDAEVDLGTKDRDKILKKIDIGDPVVFEPSFRHLTDDYYSGYGFDDKAGCFILMKCLESFKKNKPACDVVFLFSAQEETGSSKIFPVVKKYKPALVIELDVTFATDYGDFDGMASQAGRCDLGKGIAIYRGVDIFRPGVNLCETIAKKEKIPFQKQAGEGSIGYTSLEVTDNEYGIYAMVLGIPVRNMHAPVEVINYKDLITGTKLLYEFLIDKKLSIILE